VSKDFTEAKLRKTLALIDVLQALIEEHPRKILVVGCGDGAEAGILARDLKADTIGIDLGDEFRFDHSGSAPARLLKMDATGLEFADASFDFVYSFHALEHIKDPWRALSEMARILRPGGNYLVGVPNKSRLIGYFGSAVPLSTKLRWNLADLGMRLRGEWRNELGAHAGFTDRELSGMCLNAFGSAQIVDDNYYLRLYARNADLVRAVIYSGVKHMIFPCVYVFGTKTACC